MFIVKKKNFLKLPVFYYHLQVEKVGDFRFMQLLELDILGQGGIYGIETDFGNYLKTSALVCFLEKHVNNTELNVHINNKEQKCFSINLKNSLTENDLKSYKDKKRAADFGGMAVAILLVLELTEFDEFETTEANGLGFDFWLSKSSDNLSFEAISKARLEVSGIMEANSSNPLKRRLFQKIKQTEKSDNLNLPAYIVVTDFGKPESLYMERLIK